MTFALIILILGSSLAIGAGIKALAEKQNSRLLAFALVDNLGVLLLGLGLGVLGNRSGLPALSILGFGGALFHLLNFGVSAALHFVSSSRNMYLFCAACLSGIPPFGGFVPRFLILLGAFAGIENIRTIGLPFSVSLGLFIVALSVPVSSALSLTYFFRNWLRRGQTSNAEKDFSVTPKWKVFLRISLLAVSISMAILPSIFFKLFPSAIAALSTMPPRSVSNVIQVTVPETLSTVGVASCILFLLTTFLFVLRRSLPRRSFR